MIAYMLKDRIKIWGKRYFGNIADWVGVFRPEYDSWLCTDEGTKVSRRWLCKWPPGYVMDCWVPAWAALLPDGESCEAR